MYSLGIDIGSISTKGVVLDESKNIIAQDYIMTEGAPIDAVKKVLETLRKQLPEGCKIERVGTTGSARELIGTMLGASIVKNEITAHAVGTLSRHKDVKTILEIGGQDSKIILIENGIVTDYAMNTLCAAGTGAFLSSQAVRLGLSVEDLGEMSLRADKPSNIAARCTVFAESDLIHKLQTGHSKVNIVSGLCRAVVNNYLNNLCKGKRIKPPIIFQGGVSKNIGVVKAFEKELKHKIIVDECGHLMGAVGAAVLAAQSEKSCDFNFTRVNSDSFETLGSECSKCPNKCEIVTFYRNKKIIDKWGSRCGS